MREVVPDPGFDNPIPWTVDGTLVVEGGALKGTNELCASATIDTEKPKVGRLYTLRIVLSNYTIGRVWVYYGNWQPVFDSWDSEWDDLLIEGDPGVYSLDATVTFRAVDETPFELEIGWLTARPQYTEETWPYGDDPPYIPVGRSCDAATVWVEYCSLQYRQPGVSSRFMQEIAEELRKERERAGERAIDSIVPKLDVIRYS